MWENLSHFFLQWKDILYIVLTFLVFAAVCFEILIPSLGSISMSLIVSMCMFLIIIILGQLGVVWTLLSLIPISIFLVYSAKRSDKSMSLILLSCILLATVIFFKLRNS